VLIYVYFCIKATLFI